LDHGATIRTRLTRQKHCSLRDSWVNVSRVTGALRSCTPIRTYVWREDVPVAQVDYSPSRQVLYLDGDHLNTPRAARDAAGKVGWRWDSDAFGSTLPNEDPDGDGNKTTVNLRFAGQYYDQETSVHYNYYRDVYDPVIGRYTQTDPIGLASGINPYLYADARPLRFVDATGEATVVVPGSSTGNPTVDATTLALQSMLAEVAEAQGKGAGAVFGTKTHTEFAAVVRASGLPVDVEQSFSAGDTVRYGLCGSIRTDVTLRDEKGRVIAVYDVKTGQAVLTSARASEIRSEIGAQAANPNIPVIEIRYTTLSAAPK
jgi:RHS repeat-associated protein